jgi:anti-sigma factor RsiW
MTGDPLQPFDDPALKAALRRALPRETAPPSLRDRIRAELAAAAATPAPAADEPRAIPLRPKRGPLYKLAVAAILVIGFGGLAYQIYQQTRSPYDPTTFTLSDELYRDMVADHSARARHTGSPDTVTALSGAAQLATQLARPVWAADLTRDGWTFAGGAVRDVARNPAAQLFFTKGNATISVFSMPASAASGAQEGQVYDTTFEGHPIAGFVKGKGLLCIVGDKSVPLADLKALLERHRNEIAG